MRAHQIMARHVVTVGTDTSIMDAAKLMMDHRVSGLPVVDAAGRLVGIMSEGDFLRRSEIGTRRRRARWLQFLLGSGHAATDFVHERGRKVGEIMSYDPVTVTEETSLPELVELMEKKGVKRLPVMRDGRLVGIVTRADLLRAVASVAREIPDPTADDKHIHDRIVRALDAANWCPLGLQVSVRNGVVHLRGIIMDERARQAAIVAAENTSGVREVHDHLCYVDTYSGFYIQSAEDERAAAAKAAQEMAG
ncbi:CBS domain-containing protein [Bradyrhizobium septentrionale]|uniref:CBS domain-containing protein n=1 Tax=Bradyrhizobium septentrionale TaxID=1404411 RepID=A0A973W7X9_9BRAD|nr:CBS domain-containing protein [Bradyrhizobium septentrionale]UGY17857.1 CBS domain-containing protein [Bradyrhizobium septentrionale]UGY26592.1 CBS domain-containing protein [Bradyrhizobium septentrionale]